VGSHLCVSARHGNAKGNGPEGYIEIAFGLISLGAQERQGEFDPFDFASPVFSDCALAAGDEIGLNFVEARQHFRVDREHGAADARVLVRAGRSVGAAAGPEFYAPLVEVLLKLVPFVVGGLRKNPAREAFDSDIFPLFEIEREAV
jgi:hypothetical protein